MEFGQMGRRWRTRAAGGICVAYACTAFAGAQSLRHALPYVVQGPGTGCVVDESGLTWIAPVGDVDADGAVDFSIVDGRRSVDLCTNVVTRTFVAEVRSGRTGTVLWSDPAAPVLRAAGDVDGDGADDVLWRVLGQPMRVLRGRDGVEFFRLATTASAGPVGDVNADGLDDIGAPTASGVDVFSGRDGSLLRSWTPPGMPGPFAGVTLTGVGDVDFDGHSDVLVGTPDAAGGVGRATLFSGRAGAVLRVLDGDPNLAGFGRSVEAPGDVDGDGTPDLIVNGPSESVVFSGDTGAVLLRSVAGRIGAAGDVDADGRGDLVVGESSIVSGAGGGILFDAPGEQLGAIGDVSDSGVDAFVALSVSASALFGARILELAPGAMPSRERRVGAGCAGPSGRVRRLVWQGGADAGGQLRLWLRGGRPGFGAVLQAGMPASVPLGALGAPGCSLLVQPVLTAGAVPTMVSAPRYDLRIPATVPPGLQLQLQWAVWDPGTNRLGVTMSGALSLTVGG